MRPLFIFSAIALVGVTTISAQAAVCIVNDPTGSELNVRTAPNAKIIRTLRNGVAVSLEQVVSGPDGKRWAFVIDPDSGAAYGWVFHAYLACR
ncbi:SH3 domain-containing protein [Terrarubrum flagellatum]|uniref:SH3 domain-containing protein n=1 Tax=Terrirubrum flagellatum TaxID=2895980 RepID=UPI0031456928